MIPTCLQVALGISIGFLVALAGCVELGLIVKGTYTILDLGEIMNTKKQPQLAIGFSAILVIGMCIMKKIRGSFVWGMIWGTIIFWAYTDQFPTAGTVVASPMTNKDFAMMTVPSEAYGLLFGLFFLCSLALVGLSRAFSDISGLTKSDDSIPRGRFLFLVCGFATIISGLNAGNIFSDSLFTETLFPGTFFPGAFFPGTLFSEKCLLFLLIVTYYTSITSSPNDLFLFFRPPNNPFP